MEIDGFETWMAVGFFKRCSKQEQAQAELSFFLVSSPWACSSNALPAFGPAELVVQKLMTAAVHSSNVDNMGAPAFQWRTVTFS